MLAIKYHTYGKAFFDFTHTNLSDRQIGIFLRELQQLFKYDIDNTYYGSSEIPISLELYFAKYTTPRTVSIPFTAYNNALEFKLYLSTLLLDISRAFCIDLLRHAQGLNIRFEYTCLNVHSSFFHYTVQNVNVHPDKINTYCDTLQTFSVSNSIANATLDSIDILAILQKYRQNAYKYLLKYKD